MHGPSGDLKEGENAAGGERTGEEATVRRARDGDVRAFEDLYRTHVGRVYAICLRLTADEQKAEILAQDAFVQAWEKLDTFRGDSAFGTWLYRLAVNIVLQEKRSARRHRERIIHTADIPDTGRTAGTPAEESRIDLERAVAGLPERARMVFVLHDIEGYRHEEIAEKMGTSAGTSKAQLHRARMLLRKALQR